MKLIDAIEKIRKAYDIPLHAFILEDISSHSYYRYLKGKNDIKLSVAVSILKRTPITLEYFFKYMSFMNRHIVSIDHLLEALINEKVRLETYYQMYDQKQYAYDIDIMMKPYSKYKKEIQNEVSKLYGLLMIHYAEYRLNKISKDTFLEHVKQSHHACLYEMLTYQKALGILTLIHHFMPEMMSISYKKLLKASSNEALFEFGSWDVNEMISIMVLNQPLSVYQKHLETYEMHVRFIEKRLFGSLDVGFIKHIYFNQMLLAHLKGQQEALKEYALRYHMTMKMFAKNDDYLYAFPNIDILSLSREALNKYDPYMK